jgi:uncharacterized membrane protein
VNIFPWNKPKEFFNTEEKQLILEAIRTAEMQTSGEIRLFIESKCRFVDPLDRAREIFFDLGMNQTLQKNATLIYVAVKDHQAAILGDEGIHEKVGIQFWEEEVNKMLVHFSHDHLATGISTVVFDIGEVLKQHFPYESATDKNELPDDIVFGK